MPDPVGPEDGASGGVDVTENEQTWPAADAPLDGEAVEGDELARTVAERDAYLDQLQRPVAEFAN